MLLTTHYMDEAQYLAARWPSSPLAASWRRAHPPPLVPGTGPGRGSVSGSPAGVMPPAGLGGPVGPDGFIELSVDNLEKTLHELTGWAIDQGLNLDGLEVTRPTLEDVYLSLTSLPTGGEHE